MKNKLSILLICLCVQYLRANGQLSFFEVEKKVYYQVEGAVPFSDVEFYSEKWGGRFLGKTSTDERGMATLQGDSLLNPAFVLNRSVVGPGCTNGNGRVHFLGIKEFSLADLNVSKDGNRRLIRWKGGANETEPITFKVLKSSDGINFEYLSAVNAPMSNTERSYSIEDGWSSIATYYQIEVLNGIKGLRYKTLPFKLVTSSFSLFPSVAETSIKVAFNDNRSEHTFIIRNLTGQVVKKGVVFGVRAEIPLGEMSSGEYFFVINSPEGALVEKFIKR